MERRPTPTEVQGPSVVRYSVLLLLFFLKEKNISLYPRLCHRQNRKINRSPSNTCHWFHFLPGSISREYHFHPKWKGSGLLSEWEKRAWLTQGMCCVCLLCSDAIPAHSTAKDWALRGQIGKDVTLALVMLQIFFFNSSKQWIVRSGKASLPFHSLSFPCRRGHQKSVSLTSFWNLVILTFQTTASSSSGCI